MTGRPPWLHRDSGEGPGPEGPQPREMYRVDTTLLTIRDAKRNSMRPVVVVQVVTSVARVFLCTRTSQKDDGSGVFHPKNDALDLNADGWFRRKWYQSIDLPMFRAPTVQRLGWLDEETYTAVVEEVSR